MAGSAKTTTDYYVTFHLTVGGDQPSPVFMAAGEFFKALEGLDGLTESVLGLPGRREHTLLSMEPGVLEYHFTHKLLPEGQTLLGETWEAGEPAVLGAAFRRDFFDLLRTQSPIRDFSFLEELQKRAVRLARGENRELPLFFPRVSYDQLLELLGWLQQAAAVLRPEDWVELSFVEGGEPVVFSSRFAADVPGLRNMAEERVADLVSRGYLEVEALPGPGRRGRYSFRWGSCRFALDQDRVPAGTNSFHPGQLLHVELRERILTNRGSRRISSSLEILRVLGTAEIPSGHQLKVFSG